MNEPENPNSTNTTAEAISSACEHSHNWCAGSCYHTGQPNQYKTASLNDPPTACDDKDKEASKIKAGWLAYAVGKCKINEPRLNNHCNSNDQQHDAKAKSQHV